MKVPTGWNQMQNLAASTRATRSDIFGTTKSGYIKWAFHVLRTRLTRSSIVVVRGLENKWNMPISKSIAERVQTLTYDQGSHNIPVLECCMQIKLCRFNEASQGETESRLLLPKNQTRSVNSEFDDLKSKTDISFVSLEYWQSERSSISWRHFIDLDPTQMALIPNLIG